MRLLILTMVMVFFLSACEQIALFTTPKKKPNFEETQLSKLAEQNFWQTLHAGDYNKLPETINLLTAAYLENPNNPNLAAHLGFSHIWKITERERRPNQNDPSIVNEIILAKQYFHDAVALHPNDPRTHGFLGDSMLAYGNIFRDEREQVRGYYQLLAAINMWPQFNYFSAGYVMSTLNPQDKHYQQALDWQWQTLSLCAHTKITKENPDFSPYLNLETQTGPDRACWNSQIAPHNFEGFFLNMGDMLVKAGDWMTAIKIYNNAKLSKTYQAWPYQQMLETRIQNAQANVNYFNQDKAQGMDRRILFNSGYGCAVCHQK